MNLTVDILYKILGDLINENKGSYTITSSKILDIDEDCVGVECFDILIMDLDEESKEFRLFDSGNSIDSIETYDKIIRGSNA